MCSQTWLLGFIAELYAELPDDLHLQECEARGVVHLLLRLEAEADRANKQPGHGTYENDRPPIFSIAERESGTVRYFVGENADTSDCLTIIESTVPCGAAILYTDEWSGYRRVEAESDTTRVAGGLMSRTASKAVALAH
jgi:hypothetical protein